MKKAGYDGTNLKKLLHRLGGEIAELRVKAKLSQAQLAKKIGTKQSNVTRMESGEQNFTINMLDKIAHSLGKELKVSFR